MVVSSFDSPRVQASALALAARGMSVADVATSLGVTKRTAQRARSSIPGLREAWDRASELSAQWGAEAYDKMHAMLSRWCPGDVGAIELLGERPDPESRPPSPVVSAPAPKPSKPPAADVDVLGLRGETLLAARVAAMQSPPKEPMGRAAFLAGIEAAAMDPNEHPAVRKAFAMCATQLYRDGDPVESMDGEAPPPGSMLVVEVPRNEARPHLSETG